jgi:hypothetical protein
VRYIFKAFVKMDKIIYINMSCILSHPDLRVNQG